MNQKDLDKINALRGKAELNIPFMLDDYKIPEKDKHCAAAMQHIPWLESDYEMVEEKVLAGPITGVTTVFRKYKLRVQ